MPAISPRPWTAFATVSSERSRAVKLALEEDRLVLSVNAPDAGAADEELPVGYGDEPLEIGLERQIPA